MLTDAFNNYRVNNKLRIHCASLSIKTQIGHRVVIVEKTTAFCDGVLLMLGGGSSGEVESSKIVKELPTCRKLLSFFKRNATS